jgi:DHA2 family multidrug resistance protein
VTARAASLAAPPLEAGARLVNPWIIALSVMLPTFMEVLDTSIAAVALPYIAGNLGATRNEATWVLTSYLVSNAIILPVSAWFSSVFGRKRFLLACILLFTASSFLCGTATSLGMLVAARVLQGAGGGALQPLSQSILLEAFPPSRRGVALAVYGVGVVCAPIVGPTLGGWLTDNYSWRWAFYINLPIGVLAVFLISAFVTDPPYIRAARAGRIDVPGFALLSLWLSTLQIVLDQGQQSDWFGAVWIRWFSGISLASLVGFVAWELHTPAPVVNLHVLKDRNFAVGSVIFVAFGAVLYGLITLQPLFLQTLLGYTALDAGLTVSPRGVGAILAFVLVGALIRRVSPRLLLGTGFALLGLSCYFFSQFSLEVARVDIIPPNVLNGLGTGFIFVPLSTLMLGNLPNEQLGNASGIQNLVRNIGGGIGISAVSTFLERHAQAHHVFLVDRLSTLSPSFQIRYAAAQTLFAGRTGLADAVPRAQASLYALVLRQADYWAFVQVFYELIWLCGLCFVGTLLFRSVKAAGPIAVD